MRGTTRFKGEAYRPFSFDFGLEQLCQPVQAFIATRIDSPLTLYLGERRLDTWDAVGCLESQLQRRAPLSRGHS
jgi:hypothetical protein